MKMTASFLALACAATLPLASVAHAATVEINENYTQLGTDDTFDSETKTVTWPTLPGSFDGVNIADGYTLVLACDVSGETWPNAKWITGSGTLRLTQGTVTADDADFINRAFNNTSDGKFKGTIKLAAGVVLNMTRSRGGKMDALQAIIVESGATLKFSGSNHSNDNSNGLPNVDIRIAGEGARDQGGALVFTTAGVYLWSDVTLTGNATVSVTANMDASSLQGNWSCGDHILTKAGGSTMRFVSSKGISVGAGGLAITGGDISGKVTFGTGESEVRVAITATDGGTKTLSTAWEIPAGATVIFDRATQNYGEVKLTGTLSGAGRIILRARTNDDGGSEDKWTGCVTLTGGASDFTGTIQPDNMKSSLKTEQSGGNTQLSITENTTTYESAIIDLSKRTASYRWLHLPSSLTIAGLVDEDTSSSSRVTSTASSNMLTLNGSGEYRYAGKIGSGNYCSVNNNTAASASASLSVLKRGSGTQTFSGVTQHFGTLTVEAGTLDASSASDQRIDEGIVVSGSGELKLATVDLSGKTIDLSGFSFSADGVAPITATSLTVDDETILRLPEGFETGVFLSSDTTLAGSFNASNVYLGDTPMVGGTVTIDGGSLTVTSAKSKVLHWKSGTTKWTGDTLWAVNGSDSETTTFSNGDEVVFTSDATVAVSGNFLPKAIRIGEGVTVTLTLDSNTVLGSDGIDISVPAGATLTQKFSGETLSGVLRGVLTVESEGTFVLAGVPVGQGQTPVPIKGSGTVCLAPTEENTAVVITTDTLPTDDFAEFSGRLKIVSGCYRVNTAGSVVFPNNMTVATEGTGRFDVSLPDLTWVNPFELSGTGHDSNANDASLISSEDTTFTGALALVGGADILVYSNTMTLNGQTNFTAPAGFNKKGGGTLKIATTTPVATNIGEVTVESGTLQWGAGSGASVNNTYAFANTVTVSGGATFSLHLFTGNGDEGTEADTATIDTPINLLNNATVHLEDGSYSFTQLNIGTEADDSVTVEAKWNKGYVIKDLNGTGTLKWKLLSSEDRRAEWTTLRDVSDFNGTFEMVNEDTDTTRTLNLEASDCDTVRFNLGNKCNMNLKADICLLELNSINSSATVFGDGSGARELTLLGGNFTGTFKDTVNGVSATAPLSVTIPTDATFTLQGTATLSGNMTVATDGVLGGAGTVTNVLTIGEGATIDATLGLLTVGNLVLPESGTVTVKVAGTAGAGTVLLKTTSPTIADPQKFVVEGVKNAYVTTSAESFVLGTLTASGEGVTLPDAATSPRLAAAVWQAAASSGATTVTFAYGQCDGETLTAEKAEAGVQLFKNVVTTTTEGTTTTVTVAYDFGISKMAIRDIGETRYVIVGAKVQGAEGATTAADFADTTAVQVLVNGTVAANVTEVTDETGMTGGQSSEAGVKWFRLPYADVVGADTGTFSLTVKALPQATTP